MAFLGWPVLRQVATRDWLGRGPSVTSPTTAEAGARTSTADRVAQSVCPYCAVGCGQRIFVRDGHRLPRRRDAGQRGELPHQEAVHGGRRDPDREPGAHMTLRHGPRSGGLVRPGRRHPVTPGSRTV
ncbi:hypothetical protein H5397_10190 [Propioniciclava sp. MC1683]|nr:hypothetical protein [Propioniciclava sp. MC1683]